MRWTDTIFSRTGVIAALRGALQLSYGQQFTVRATRRAILPEVGRMTSSRGASLALLALVVSGIPVLAACSGSGSAFSCPAGSSVSDVQTALNNASDGAVITLATGSYTWSGEVQFSNSKGATLICASPGACTISTGGTPLGMNGTVSGANTHFYRISGFTFNESSANFVIWFYGPGVMTQVRIDHNTFNVPAGAVAIFFGENSTVANFYGVIDHNTMISAGSAALLNMIGTTNNAPPSAPLGTVNNMFVEDNTVTITTMTDAGEGCMDGWGGDAIVWRHNTTLNCLVTSHGATHAGGPQNLEFYNNHASVNGGSSGAGVADGYRLFHHQGSGEFVAFNNTFTAFSGKNSDALAMMDYRAYANSIDGGAPICDGTQSIDGNRSPATTYRGYPCWHQPGRDFAGILRPMYIWNNTWSDTGSQIDMTMEDMGGSPDYTPNHEQANRDYFNAVSATPQSSPTSPFNGTTGMGFGTLANRPATCSTAATDAGDAGHGGVGYFATDQGPQGTLYTCTSTNTWRSEERR